MIQNNENEFAQFVYQQMLFMENLNEHLSKASSLIQLALQHAFFDLPKQTRHDYLWALSDIIQTAHTCSTNYLNRIFEACRIMNTPLET